MTRPNITQQQILDYAAGILPEPQRRQVETHLQHSPDSRRSVALYQAVQRQVARNDSVPPSPAAIARAQAAFKAPPQAAASGAAGWLAAIDRVIANIVFDSRVHAVGGAAVRHAGNRLVTLCYEVEHLVDGRGPAMIDVQVERVERPLGDAFLRVTGQVSANDPDHEPGGAGGGSRWEGLRLAVCRGGGAGQSDAPPVMEVPVDQDGMFTFEMPVGEYEVFLRPGGAAGSQPSAVGPSDSRDPKADGRGQRQGREWEGILLPGLTVSP